MTCSDCGHVWKGEKGNLCDTIAGCKCPNCGTELKVKDTRKRTHKETAYFSVITGKTGADWDSAPEQTGTLLMRQS